MTAKAGVDLTVRQQVVEFAHTQVFPDRVVARGQAAGIHKVNFDVG
jgi:hypothetical protein